MSAETRRTVINVILCFDDVSNELRTEETLHHDDEIKECDTVRALTKSITIPTLIRRVMIFDP